MTKQEIKEEYKETEGDPQIKSAIKSRQQSLSRSRMMQNVPQADVVIRNPTHYAVAIKYDPDADSAPRVVAKGAGYLALRIIEEAEKHGVIVTENRTLARGLYEAVEIEQEIPSSFITRQRPRICISTQRGSCFRSRALHRFVAISVRC